MSNPRPDTIAVIRQSFKDRSDWKLTDVSIGTEYFLLMVSPRSMSIMDRNTKEKRQVNCLFVCRRDGSDGGVPGWLPIDIFRE